MPQTLGGVQKMCNHYTAFFISFFQFQFSSAFPVVPDKIFGFRPKVPGNRPISDGRAFSAVQNDTENGTVLGPGVPYPVPLKSKS